MQFIIYAPPFDPASGGSQALYELNKDLNKIGYKSQIMSWDKIHPYNQDSIVIYPEIIPNNPINASKVVRYFLHRDGFIFGKPVNIGPNDFILTWSEQYIKNYHARLYKYVIPEYFNDKNTKPTLERLLDCTYVGKGSGWTDQPCRILPNTIHIGSNGYLPRKSLSELFKITRIIYNYDALSMLNVEAVLCGALVTVLEYRPFTKQDFENTDLEYPTITVDNNQIILPINYFEQRERFINKVYSINKNYLNTLTSVIEKIQKHFNC